MKAQVAITSLIISILAAAGCYQTTSASTADRDYSAEDIMRQAHEKAGCEFWRRPQSLSLIGHGIFYQDQDTFIHESHKMYRVYDTEKSNAHSANGKVRIESYRNGRAIIMLSFDGEHTYDLSGKQDKSDADKRWASNFGYGAIRHALDPGYSLTLIGEDVVQQQKTYTIEVTDPNQGKTNFDITQDGYEIVKVAFDTPRGWHHRIYSNFFSKVKYSWHQAGLVELYYNDKKTNEIIWTDFDVNEDLPDELFIL